MTECHYWIVTAALFHFVDIRNIRWILLNINSISCLFFFWDYFFSEFIDIIYGYYIHSFRLAFDVPDWEKEGDFWECLESMTKTITETLCEVCLVVDFQLKIDTGDFFSMYQTCYQLKKKTYLTEWMKREIIRLWGSFSLEIKGLLFCSWPAWGAGHIL